MVPTLPRVVDEDQDVGAVLGARLELEAARQWFEWATDPGQVDEAIFRLRAAELRLSRAMVPLRAAVHR